jgi:hypothetical protein
MSKVPVSSRRLKERHQYFRAACVYLDEHLTFRRQCHVICNKSAQSNFVINRVLKIFAKRVFENNLLFNDTFPFNVLSALLWIHNGKQT